MHAPKILSSLLNYKKCTLLILVKVENIVIPYIFTLARIYAFVSQTAFTGEQMLVRFLFTNLFFRFLCQLPSFLHDVGSAPNARTLTIGH